MFSVLALGVLALTAPAHASEEIGAIPAKISLMARTPPPGSSHRRRALGERALGPANVPLANFFDGTDLQWYGNISVGTPPQEITVVFDTGSATLEFASTRCGSSCDDQVKFDYQKSSTFVDGGQTTSIAFSTGVGVDPVVNNDYVLTLRTGMDTVSVGGLEATDVDLYLITKQTSKFEIDPFSGIQGMGPQAEGFFAGLIKKGLPSLFSLYLTPKSKGNAELTIGGIDDSKFTGNLIYAANEGGDEDSWTLSSPAIYVNGKTTSTLKQQRGVIFDSGTSNVLFDTQTAEAMYALISPEIKANQNEPGTYGIACSLIPTLPATIDITFTSQKGTPFNLTIPSSELSVGPFANDPSTCQTLINAYDGLELVGGSLLKHYYSVWDIGNQQMGFAPNGF